MKIEMKITNGIRKKIVFEARRVTRETAPDATVETEC